MTVQQRRANLGGGKIKQDFRNLKTPDQGKQKHINKVSANEQRLELSRRYELQQIGALLNLEEKIRKCKTADQVLVLAANETRNLAGARQVFVMQWKTRSTLFISSISSLDKVDYTSPFVRWLTRVSNKMVSGKKVTELTHFHISEFSKADDPELKTYPFPYMNWLPLFDDDGESIGGILLAKEIEWDNANQARLLHLSRAFSHALSRFTKKNFRRSSRGKSKFVASVIGLLLGASLFYPVPMTTLAPVSITPRDAFVVTTPIDGVIKRILVEPNSYVSAGELIIQLEDEGLINSHEVAKRELEEAETRLKSLTKSSFLDLEAKRDLRVVASQVKIKSAELEHAEMLLERSKIKASRNGVVVFADREKWTGRPVQTGEQIMKIANPEKFEFTIEVPVADAIVLGKNARVKYFMDSAPLDPIEGIVRYASFEATEQAGNTLAYTIIADRRDGNELQNLRLGSQGTAQLYGDEVPLYLYLFRKPISAFRQYTGI